MLLLNFMVLSCFFPLKIFGEICTNCEHKTVHRMLTADCYDKKLREIPNCLRSGIEVLELSFNRIRAIKDDDLNRFSSVKLLYLADNMITKIEDNAFSSLSSLISLDLSINSLNTIPSTIFHLPSLKKLYLGQNENINIVEVVNESKPIISPLEHIDISNNGLQELPHFGTLPTLLTYNISGNNVRRFSLKNIAGLCKLQSLINDDFSAEYENLCDCWKITRWMELKGIQFTTPLNCPISQDACTYQISEWEMEDYEECMSRFDELILQKRLLTIGLPVCLIIVLILIVVIFLICRRKKRKMSRRKNYNNIILNKNEDSSFVS